MTSPERKQRSAPDPETRLTGIEAEIARVRARDEKRLISIAEKAGLFEVRLTASQTGDMIRQTIATLKPAPSTLANLTAKKVRAARARRKVDGRRKALLGGFVVAQCRHKSDLHASLVPDIRAFLEDHPTPHVAERNLTLLAPFLADPADTGTSGDAGDGDRLTVSDHQMRTHRHILLGTWLLKRRAADPAIASLIADELEGFLRDDSNTARNRALLADLLESAPQTVTETGVE